MSDAYTTLVARCLFPLHERLKGHGTTRLVGELERTQHWDAEALAELQASRLRALLETIAARVPYYRDLFREAGVRPAEIRSPRDLPRLPFLTKSDIRAHAARFTAEGARGLRRVSTGGSTGEPLRFFVGPRRVTSDVASRWRAMRWWGVDVGDREVVLWGSHIELTHQDRVRAIRDRLLRSTLLSANSMTPARMDEYLDVIRRARPRHIVSHPSALAELARHAEERGRPMAGLGIRVAFVTAEELYAHQRRRIERVFGCPVANGYGGRDSGFVAHECPAGGMHLNFEEIVVEAVDDQGRTVPTGRAGEIVVTHLGSADFPFVRYRTGDVGVLDDASCRCGLGLPLLREIHGRADDLLLAQDGGRVPGQAVVLGLRDVPGIRAFKIVQEGRDLVRVLLVVAPEFQSAARETIRTAVRGCLGSGMEVEVLEVSELPREASGKYRTVLNRLGMSPSLEAEAPAP